MPGREELPSTLQRSPKKAQETWIKAHDSAVEQYGEGQRSHRVAFSALKHQFEKVGDHWEPKGRKGPSDKRASDPGARRKGSGGTAQGVDANASKSHLLDVAKRLGTSGRTRMRKDELVKAIKAENRRETARARGR